MHPDFRLSPEEIESLRAMSEISVRDEKTKRLLQKSGFSRIIETLDPTFLYNFEIFTKDFRERNFILVYCFSDWNEYSEKLRQFAKEKKLKIIYLILKY